MKVCEPDSCPHPEPRWWILSACIRIYHSRGEAVNHSLLPIQTQPLLTFSDLLFILLYWNSLCFISSITSPSFNPPSLFLTLSPVFFSLHLATPLHHHKNQNIILLKLKKNALWKFHFPLMCSYHLN